MTNEESTMRTIRITEADKLLALIQIWDDGVYCKIKAALEFAGLITLDKKDQEA